MSWRAILRNVCSNWVGYLITSIVGFLLSPFVVHHLGETGYGVWTLIVSLTGYFGMLDLGIRSSVGRFVARHLALHDEAGVNRTISAALAILFASGTAALAATLVLSYNLGAFSIPPVQLAAARWALLFAGVNIALALPAGVSGGLLIALERYDVMTAITVGCNLARAALVVLALNSNRGLVALAAITLFLSMCEYFSMALAAKSLYRPLRPAWSLVDKATIRELSSFGAYRFIWTAANQLIFYTDSIVIGLFLSAAAITPYAIGGTLITYGRTVVSLATDTLYPSATRLDSRRDLEGLRDLLIFGTKLSLSLAIPLCLGFVFLGKQFIALWMGEEYQSSAVFLAILAIPQVTSMSHYTSALILTGMAKHKDLAYVAAGEGVVNLALSIFLVQKIGLVGVAWGTVIPHLFTSAIILPWLVLKAVQMPALEYYKRAWIGPSLSGIPAGILCYFLSTLTSKPSLLQFAGEVAAVAVCYGSFAFFLCLTPNQQSEIASKLKVVLRGGATIYEA